VLDALTHESFLPHVGTDFPARLGPDATLGLTLIEVEATGPAPAGGATRRRPFSLLFRGPRAPVLPQRIYRLEHAALGPLEIFIVPIGPDAHGMRYEAIFT
jgi:hypothetical protein